MLWLRDFLPKDLPHSRVLLFGYNANLAFESSTAGVEEQAGNLLNKLKWKRRDAEKRPLLFVCHSLGGIVVKKALVEAKLNSTYSQSRCREEAHHDRGQGPRRKGTSREEGGRQKDGSRVGREEEANQGEEGDLLFLHLQSAQASAPGHRYLEPCHVDSELVRQ